VKKSRDAGDGKPPEFRRFEAAVIKILTVSKSELEARMNHYNADKPHRRGPKPKVTVR
jgi:hypothetical protein